MPPVLGAVISSGQLIVHGIRDSFSALLIGTTDERHVGQKKIIRGHECFFGGYVDASRVSPELDAGYKLAALANGLRRPSTTLNSNKLSAHVIYIY